MKEEYKDAFIGGAMLRTDLQWFQTESGGTWNGGRLVSHKQGLDLRNLDACLYNEVEEKYEFNAWWYCTMPLNIINKKNLPMPIFIFFLQQCQDLVCSINRLRLHNNIIIHKQDMCQNF